jgi:hypothetical protein
VESWALLVPAYLLRIWDVLEKQEPWMALEWLGCCLLAYYGLWFWARQPRYSFVPWNIPVADGDPAGGEIR